MTALGPVADHHARDALITMLWMRLQHRCVRVRAGVRANMCHRLRAAGCLRQTTFLCACHSVRVQS